ncbi:MAG: hypothetical protein K1X53_06905 [Candidatus Sumerlaeaceae bacterium]|nr:hypothetical protein [Candidatus Sumerlaeaceae bacterium]
MTAFADTFYFLALLNSKDRAHGPAVVLSRKSDLRIVTTEWVLTEVADACCSVSHRGMALRLIQTLRQSPYVHIVASDHRVFQRGLDLYEARPDKDWSLTDCISFVIMGEQGLSEALTGDKHFEQAGFRPVLV